MNLSSQNYKSCQIFRHVVNVQRSNSLFLYRHYCLFFGTHDAPNHYFVLFFCPLCNLPNWVLDSVFQWKMLTTWQTKPTDTYTHFLLAIISVEFSQLFQITQKCNVAGQSFLEIQKVSEKKKEIIKMQRNHPGWQNNEHQFCCCRVSPIFHFLCRSRVVF